MKVYYEFPPSGNDDYDKIIRMMFEKWKYQMMWALRHLEREMEEEGGCIIIQSPGTQYRFVIRDFSYELTEKIDAILRPLPLENFTLTRKR